MAANFNLPNGLAVDANGNLFVADTVNQKIRRISAAGVTGTVAGIAGISGSADGTASTARFDGPSGVAVDASGNLYVADYYQNLIRKITSNGAVTTLAGAGGFSGSSDGFGSAGRFNGPCSVAVDGSGNVFVADTNNHTIRKILGPTINGLTNTLTPAGTVTTFAGSAGNPGNTDASGAAARFNGPTGIAVDGAGNVYVADYYNSTIRKITSSGGVTTLAGLSGSAGSADGIGTAARFRNPFGVAVDGSGNVFVADTGNHTIRKITPAGVVTTVAGGAGSIGASDGTGSVARFNNPKGVAVRSNGDLFVADTSSHTIRRIVSSNTVTTFAGTTGIAGSTDSTGIAAQSLGWRSLNTGILSGGYKGAAYGAGKYVMLATAHASVSSDGTTWTAGSLPAGTWRGIVFGNGLFVVAGGTLGSAQNILTSLDGSTWTVRATGSGDLNGIATLPGRTIAVGEENSGQNAVVSTDGITWTRVAVGQSSTTLSGIVSHPVLNNFVAWSRSSRDVWVTANGSTWTRATLPGTGNITAVTAADDVYLALAGTHLYSSADGVNWQASHTIPTPGYPSNHILGGFSTTGIAATGSFASGNAMVVVSGQTSSSWFDPAGFFSFQTVPYAINSSGGAAAWNSVALGNLGIHNNGFSFYANGLFFLGYDEPLTTNPSKVFTAPLSPSITAQPPATSSALIGGSVTFTVGAAGAGLNYRWKFNGATIAGATSATFTITNVTAANAGEYSVTVTNAAGSAVTTSTSVLNVASVPVVVDARLFAISCRAVVGTGGDILIPGIIIGGTGSRQVVVRAGGPAIQGVSGILTRPELKLYKVGVANPIATNTGWSSGTTAQTQALQAAFSSVNLPPYPVGSADCALLATVEAGAAYTATISGADGTTGVALVEVYEIGAGSARMTALSCRAQVGTGGGVLIPGIVISGTSSKQVIIRAKGPGIVGVSGVLTQPTLALYNGSNVKIAENTRWNSATNAAAIASATSAIGLDPLTPGSGDCALLVTLAPGGYTAQVGGLDSSVGVALIEIYEVP